jgi:hypothetical protein
MRAVRSSEVVEALPFVQFGFEIYVTFITKKLIEFLLVGPMGSFDFAVELGCTPFDVGMPDPEIFDMPMELCLELVTVVGSHFANAEWKLFDDVVNEVDRVCLRVLLVDLEGANSGCIVACCMRCPCMSGCERLTIAKNSESSIIRTEDRNTVQMSIRSTCQSMA